MQFGWTYDLSHTLLQSAAFFARQTFIWEERLRNRDGQDLGEVSHSSDSRLSQLTDEHHAYCLSAVALSVSFIDASVSGIFAYASDSPGLLNHYGLSNQQTANLALISRLKLIPRQTLERAQVALSAAGKEQFIRGENPFQDTNALLRLRNAFIHSAPETTWFPSGDLVSENPPTDGYELEYSRRFKANSALPNVPPYFPYLCMGHGCAEWAVMTSTRFVSEFFDRLGLSEECPFRIRVMLPVVARPEATDNPN